jgi:LCP family protein required for cell wall assembly
MRPNEPARRVTPEPAGRPPLWLRRILLVAGLVLLLGGSAIAGFSVIRHESPVQLIAETFVPTPQDVFGKPNLLVLLEGLDYDYNEKDIEFSTNSRSDVIKVVNLDFVNKKVYVLSVPRDMVATLPDGRKRKINEAQSDGGEKEAAQVIAQFLGIPGFDRYAILRIDASKDIISAIGGVDVYVKNSDCLMNHTNCTGGSIDYDDTWGHLHTHLKEGMQHLNGEQAVGYGRFRHDWCSDPCRIMRQDQVIAAIVDKLKGDKLNTLLSANNLIGVVHKDVETNMAQNEIVSLAAYFSGITPKDVTFKEVPYTGDVEMPDGDDLLVDETGKNKLVQEMLIAPPSPEVTPDAVTLAGIAPSSLRVDVENGSGVSGAARLVATMLKRQGYVIGTVGNADASSLDTSEIHEHSNVTFAGAKVRSALPPALSSIPVTTEVAPSPAASATASDVTIVIGRDLAALAAGAPATATPGT